MRILLCIISVGFGAVIFNILKLGVDWIVALIGAAMICIAALWNGKRNGNFHIQHHIIRIALSFVLVIGFIFL